MPSAATAPILEVPESALRRGYVSSADLMEAYWQAEDDPDNAEKRARFKQLLEAFQDKFGVIIDFYAFPKKPDPQKKRAALIQTEKSRSWPLRQMGVRPLRHIEHVVNTDDLSPAEVSTIFSRLLDLEARAQLVLRGADRLRLSDDIMYSLTTLAEQCSEGPLSADQVAALNEEYSQLVNEEQDAARRGIPLTYVGGMFLGLIPVALLAMLVSWLLSRASIDGFARHTFASAALFGSVGAIVSVMMRMTANRFTMPLDTARDYVRLLGAIRPIIGAVSGVFIYFAVMGQLLAISIADNGDKGYFAYSVLGFIAGFSERWVNVLIGGITMRVGDKDKEDSDDSAGAQSKTEPSS